MDKFSDEQRAKIITEYEAAVAAGNGGGAAVARRYGVIVPAIYNWIHAAKRNGGVRRKPGRPIAALPQVPEPVAVRAREPVAPLNLTELRSQLEVGIADRSARLIGLKVLEDEIAVMRRALDALSESRHYETPAEASQLSA